MRRKWMSGVIFLCLLCFAGCGKGGKEPAVTEASQPESRADFDWRSEEILASPGDMGEVKLYPAGYTGFDLELPCDGQGKKIEMLDGAWLEYYDSVSAVYGDEIYYIVKYSAERDEQSGEDAGEEGAEGDREPNLPQGIANAWGIADSAWDLYTFQYYCNSRTGESRWEQIRPASEMGADYCDADALVGVSEDALFFAVRGYDYDPETELYTLTDYRVVRTDRQRKILGETDLMGSAC